MVESRGRKAAFLREAVRALELQDVEVENQRFEDVAGKVRPHTIDLVSIRAVRNAPVLLSAIHRVLSQSGRAFVFHSSSKDSTAPEGFAMVEAVRLGTGHEARLSILKPMFRNKIVD
jgi:16S rRNA G527 N7-methylase RsmG